MSKRWYVVHTYSGYENRVKSDLEHRIETMGMQDRIFDIQIPTEHVTELKEGGKRDEKDVKIFPGYVPSVWRWMMMPGRASATPLVSPVSSAAAASPLRFPAMSTTR